MGIFDVFKTKVGEAAEKAGDVAGKTWDKAGEVAGQAKDKVSDLMDKKKDGAAGDSGAQAPPEPESPAGTAERASDMVSEGAPVSATGEAAPGVGDDGMTQTIKDNVSKGADKAGEMAEGATGNRHDDKIDSGVQQAKDKLG